MVSACVSGQLLKNACFRYDEDKNKHYYIDELGKKTECGRNGKWPAQFLPNKTGVMSFAERQEIGKKVRMP
jgi:hypothetical protein